MAHILLDEPRHNRVQFELNEIRRDINISLESPDMCVPEKVIELYAVAINVVKHEKVHSVLLVFVFLNCTPERVS